MKTKLFHSELEIIDILSRNGHNADKQIPWSKKITYTLINRDIDKEAIERIVNLKGFFLSGVLNP